MTTPSGARGSRRAGTAEREAARAPERKLISVLFADIRGATALVDGLDPEDALARIEPVIAAMEAAVSRFEGTVSKSQGDEIVAFFGAPIGTDDHAVQACFAALQMHRDIAKLGDPDVQIRVGINSGEVVLTQRDRDLSSIYDAAGAVVHTAQRLEAAARAGSTLISRSCLALTSARFSVRDAGTASLKGLHEPVETFELIGPTKISRWQARIARGMSRFVGRDAEMATLRTAAADVAAGRSPNHRHRGSAGLWQVALGSRVDTTTSRTVLDRVGSRFRNRRRATMPGKRPANCCCQRSGRSPTRPRVSTGSWRS